MNKVVIVVLVVIVVVFVIFVTRGSLTKDQPQSNSKTSDAKTYSREKKAPGWTRAIKNAFAAVGKKLKLDCPPNVPPDADYQCKSLALNKEIRIPGDKGTSFRVVTFELIGTNAAVIKYEDDTEGADKYELDEQKLDLPNPDTDDPKIGSIVILEKGGRMTISCQDVNKPCQVAQK
jgi:hypothetical protein